MNLLPRFVRGVDALNDWIGRTVAWLTVACVLTCFAVVVLRYGFNLGYPWLQELYVWQHATVFMAGAGYTMLHRGHVNVDVMYGRLGPRGQAWIDILGTLIFLFPWLAVLAWTSAPFVLESWRIRGRGRHARTVRPQVDAVGHVRAAVPAGARAAGPARPVPRRPPAARPR
jgi:TRAP-type mannitol/chloroaromatic compound transport system permease small subunit